ncbi:hypothetical protein ACHQM5_026784 [Ranunculus cassubicifolius]
MAHNQRQLLINRENGRRRSTAVGEGLVLTVDILSNLICIAVAIVMILVSQNENPNTPLRLWISVWALQRIIHLLLSVMDSTDDGDERVAGGAIWVNILVTSMWWVVGCYWLVAGGDMLLQDAPHLYWFTIVFLGFSALFTLFYCVVKPYPCHLCCLSNGDRQDADVENAGS